MATIRGSRVAFGAPGIDPKWTAGSKDGVGTAFSDASNVWFTLWNGILTETYWPTVDSPQLRDMQFLITDGETFFHEEKRDLETRTEHLSTKALAYKITNREPQGRYTITKEVLTDPQMDCVLQRVRIDIAPELRKQLKLFVLCAPHMSRSGANNNAYVVEQSGREILVASKEGASCALGATVPFTKLSCGYVGSSDGWQDVSQNMQMTWEFDQATNGNVAMIAELDISSSLEFTLGLGYGNSLQSAVTTLFQSLAMPFEERKKLMISEWEDQCHKLLSLERYSTDDGCLFHSSYCQLIAHEDKNFPGAFIASMSIPWGESKGDEDLGGYHLVWTRDLVNTATALLAAGDLISPFRALIYLAACQQHDGGFPQNFWIDGEAYWKGIQLDEVAFPILLARKLSRENALQDFDPYVMVMRAAAFLIKNGPVTEQERWEESSGYSPSTLASNIAALICAACFAKERGDVTTANYIEDYADFLESHLEAWTVTRTGTLVEGIAEHYVRIQPIAVSDYASDEELEGKFLSLKNQEPGKQADYPAKEIVDAGFLELVRYGVRSAHDPIIVDSVRVVDRVLRTETPFGPSFHRYNHDGYGQRDDGGPFEVWGTGRLWPLLTGERGHYELAAGNDPRPYVKTLEDIATKTKLLTEQVWDEVSGPETWLKLGEPTGAAMPLMWAHAEYIKLLRSVQDGNIFDSVPEVVERYQTQKNTTSIEIWKPNRQVQKIRNETLLRLQCPYSFQVQWSIDDWKTTSTSDSAFIELGIFYFDIKVEAVQERPIRFVILKAEESSEAGVEHIIDVQPS